jgi:hypothetical protein
MGPAVSERPPESESVLETYIVDGRSLAAWHTYLTTDKETGEPNGYLDTPGSKYGSKADECAWWAVAAHSTYTYLQGAVGEEYDAEESMALFMELAVNNHWGLVHLVREMKDVLPSELVDMLDWDRARDG